MSDSCMYELLSLRPFDYESQLFWENSQLPSPFSTCQLEDIVWEEFGDNDDHIVPLTGGQKNGYGIESDSSKRQRCEPTSTENNAASKSASENVSQGKEESRFCAAKDEKEMMLENSSTLHSSGEVASALLGGESNTKTSHSASTESMTSECLENTNIDYTACELNEDPIHGDQTAFMDNDLHHHQLNNASHTEKDLGFFDEESSDLLCFRWPDMETFENVDEIFRSCDSLFGLEVDNDDDELDWFSPSQAVLAGSDDVSKSNFNTSEFDPRGINSVTELQEVYRSDKAGFVVDEIGKKLTPVDWKRYSQTSDDSSIVMNLSCSNGSGAVSSVEGDPQVCSRVNQSKNQKPSESEGKRKEHSLSIEDSLHFGNLKQAGDLDQSLNFQCIMEENEQKQNIEPRACLQTSIPWINSYSGHPSNQVLARPRSSIIKSKHSGFPSLSPRKSSSSNQMQATESSRDVSLQHPSGYKKKDRASKRRLKVKIADSDPVSGQTHVPNFENEAESRGEVNGSDSGVPGELDSSTIPGSSCLRSVLDGVTVEESSFQLLQLVLEQLDIRTKLCIRDSLYRLARSAEQRQKCMYPTSMSSEDQNQSRAFISDELNKSDGFIDVETDTNPIDRSIAHLLFHRPPDPSATATIDVGPMKLVEAPNVTAVKLVGEGEPNSGTIKLSKDESKDCEI